MTPITRRQFLEQSTAAATAAAIAIANRPAHAAGGMFVSLNGALTSGKQMGPWPEFARLAAKLGYGGVDWSLGPAKMAGLDATRALFQQELKIKPTIVNLPLTQPFAGDDAAFEQKLPALVDDAAFCDGIGCHTMMLVLSATSTGPKDEFRKIVVARLSAISAVLQKSNIRLGLEFLGPLYMRGAVPSPCPARGGGAGRGGGQQAPAAAPGAAPAGAPPATAAAPAPAAAPGGGQRGPAGPREPFIWNLNDTVALAKDCGPNIGAVLDAWHWHHAGSTVADIVAAGKSRIIHVHVSDAKDVPPETVCDNPRLMPGEGVINLVGFFQALKKIGYEEGVSPEPLARVPMEMSAEEGAKLGLDTTLAVMKKAGVL